MLRLCSLVVVGALTGMLGLVGDAEAAHKHHAGHEKLGNKINTNGKHHLHKTDNHSIHAHVSGKKITGVTATHDKTGKQVKVTKYKSTKRHHVMNESSDGTTQYVMEETAFDTVWIGFGFSDGFHFFIFWFPIDLVDGGDDGAVTFVVFG